MVPLNFGKVHQNQNGSWQIWTWKWFVQNKDVLIRFRAGFSSSRAQRSHPRWLATQPWSGGGARSSYSRVSDSTSPELKLGSDEADRGSRGLQRAGLSWGRPVPEQLGRQTARQPLGRARLLAAISAGFGTTGWSGGDAGVLSSVEGLSPVGGVAGTGWSGGAQWPPTWVSGRERESWWKEENKS